ncbi:hypothetical protein [Marinicella litoralis]|uniref:Uncharacterized protein n=1 Tax=Marinicella litoralis TaxID=644220 RepID=A0A4R6XRK7_9GAMM|nr:hypothetical protein [Marinicella litoralis]TDR20537.1 hypothetical protein C8D91_1511 [Marinicella litoralis]
MKTLFSLITILWVLSSAQASDVSCQVNVLKPKLSATVIQQESEKPANITVAEARLRLKHSAEQRVQETAQTEPAEEETELSEEPAEKESGLGSMFDILIPSKLRNPVQ